MDEKDKENEESVTAPELSEYERIRAANIERNNARLRSLGLISTKEEQESNALAWKHQQHFDLKSSSVSNSNDDDDSRSCQNKKNSINKRKRKSPSEPTSSSAQPPPPGRKSLRLQGKQPDGKELAEGYDDDGDETATSLSKQEQRQECVLECRRVRMEIANQFANLSEAERKAAKENPTATYQHCAMRITTMTDKALMNRIRAIERAAGKHSLIKMAIFKSCLQEANLWELADQAKDALERLKALKALPPSE